MKDNSYSKGVPFEIRKINEEFPPSITITSGTYFKNDVVTLFHNRRVTMKEVAAISLLIGRNEDNRYKHGEGRKRFQRYLNTCLDRDWLFSYQKLGLDN